MVGATPPALGRVAGCGRRDLDSEGEDERSFFEQQPRPQLDAGAQVRRRRGQLEGFRRSVPKIPQCVFAAYRPVDYLLRPDIDGHSEIVPNGTHPTSATPPVMEVLARWVTGKCSSRRHCERCNERAWAAL